MRNIIFYLFALFCLFSCTLPQSPKVSDPAIVMMVDSFASQHPNFMNNALTKESANMEWKKAILDSISSNPHFLDSIPVEFIRINKNAKGQYMAQFRSNNYNKYRNIREFYFDVLMEVPDSIATTLVEKKEYIFTGQIIGAIDYKTMRYLYGAPLNVYTDDYKFTKYEYAENKYDIYMASFYLAMETIAGK